LDPNNILVGCYLYIYVGRMSVGFLVQGWILVLAIHMYNLRACVMIVGASSVLFLRRALPLFSILFAFSY
jgi:hypothetical protein